MRGGGGAGQGGENLLAPPRQGRKGKSGGKRGWEEDQAAATCRIRLPLRPRDARVGRRGPSPPALPGRHSPLPPFFPANVYLNARAHTEIVRLFYPSGKKEQGVERKRRQSEELLGRALHSEPRLGAGTLLPPPPPTRSLPGPAACASGSASQGTRFWGHRDFWPPLPRQAEETAARRALPPPFPPPPPRPARSGGQAQGSREEQRPRRSAPRLARPWMRRPGEPGDNFAG